MSRLIDADAFGRNDLMNLISFYPGLEVSFSKERDYVKIKVSKYAGKVLCCSNKLIDEEDLPFVDSVIHQLIDEVEKMAAKNTKP